MPTTMATLAVYDWELARRDGHDVHDVHDLAEAGHELKAPSVGVSYGAGCCTSWTTWTTWTTWTLPLSALTFSANPHRGSRGRVHVLLFCSFSCSRHRVQLRFLLHLSRTAFTTHVLQPPLLCCSHLTHQRLEIHTSAAPCTPSSS